MTTSPFSFGTLILGGGALLLTAFLLVGFLLPGTWEARRALRVDAPPEVVFSHLDAPSAWRAWTALPDTGLTLEGPERGRGARMRWNHPECGSGSFEIVEAQAGGRVAYAVEVQEGAMRTDGVLELTPDEGGTLITWTERGDFGWNPLMGYWSLFMGRAQGRELEKNLAGLAELLSATPDGTTPADSVPAGVGPSPPRVIEVP
jgi:uncharacterized protein YndB with AHSA1/START domain